MLDGTVGRAPRAVMVERSGTAVMVDAPEGAATGAVDSSTAKYRMASNYVDKVKVS